MVKLFISILKYKINSCIDRKKHISAIVSNSKIDQSAAIRQKCRIYNSSVGRYSYIARNTLIQHTDIGSFCSISENCNIGMPSHPISLLSTSPVFLSGGNYLHRNFSEVPFEDCPLSIIGNDVWIGAAAQVKSGIVIGDGAIIAAGAVVTKDVPAFAIVAGVPAKIIKYRFDDEVIERIKKARWWEWSESKIQEHIHEFSMPLDVD